MRRIDPALPPSQGAPGEGEAGQGLAEYSLILMLVAVACVGALSTLAGPISDAITRIVPHFG